MNTATVWLTSVGYRTETFDISFDNTEIIEPRKMRYFDNNNDKRYQVHGKDTIKR